jgi:hypothetical protein
MIRSISSTPPVGFCQTGPTLLLRWSGKNFYLTHLNTWLTRKKIIEIKSRKTRKDSEYYLNSALLKNTCRIAGKVVSV